MKAGSDENDSPRYIHKSEEMNQIKLTAKKFRIRQFYRDTAIFNGDDSYDDEYSESKCSTAASRNMIQNEFPQFQKQIDRFYKEIGEVWSKETSSD